MQPSSFKDLVAIILELFDRTVVPLIFAFAFVAFLWGVARYMVFPGDEENKKKGKQVILWGIIGFTIMVAVWGIVNILYRSLFF